LVAPIGVPIGIADATATAVGCLPLSGKMRTCRRTAGLTHQIAKTTVFQVYKRKKWTICEFLQHTFFAAPFFAHFA
jgi:hypothetical protein